MNNSIHQYFLDNITDPVWVVDLNYKYIYANENYKEFHSLNKNILGEKLSDIIPQTFAKTYIKEIKSVIKNKKQMNFEEEFEGRAFECRTFPILDKKNKIKAIGGIIVDITEKKFIEDKLSYLSYTDSLTKVYNRASFEAKISDLKLKNRFPIGIIMGDVNGLKLVNDTFGHIEGDKLLVEIAEVLKSICKKETNVFRWGGDEFIVLMPKADEAVCEKTISNIRRAFTKRKRNAIELSMSMGFSVMEDVSEDIDEILKTAEEKVYKHKLLEQKSIFSGAINSLQETLEAKSFETKAHTQRMTRLVRKLGENMNLPSAELDELEIATRLHDIGKIGIREEILLKPGKLTDEEYRIIKTHTEKGYRIVMASSGLESVAKTVLTHHERWDGNGYPLGLSKKDIPLTARIISVVDAFDAMTNNRIYRSALSKQSALEEIVSQKGKQFDPEIVDIFLDMIIED